MWRAGACVSGAGRWNGLQPRMGLERMDHDLRLGSAVTSEILQFPLNAAFEFNDPLVPAVLEAFIGADANDVIQIDKLAAELDPHERPLLRFRAELRDGSGCSAMPMIQTLTSGSQTQR